MRLSKRICLAILIAAMSNHAIYAQGSAPAQKQNTNPTISCEQELIDAVKSTQGAMEQIEKILDFNGDTFCAAELVFFSPQYEEGNSIDVSWLAQVKATLQQNGASVGSGGTTNLVSKGESAKILSLAAEYGALTQSVNNQTVTAQGTLAGVPVALVRNDIFADCAARLVAHQPCVNEKTINVLSRFSYSVSFDASSNNQTLSGTPNGASQGTAQPVTFVANAHQISQATAKVALIPGKAANSSAFLKAVDASVKSGKSPTGSAAAAIVTAGQKLKQTANSHAEFQQWLSEAKTLLAAQKPEQIVNEWHSLACSFVEVLGGPKPSSNCKTLGDIPSNPDPSSTLLRDSITYVEAYSNYLISEQSFTESLRAAPILSFEFDNNRPASQPTNSSLRLIYGQGFGKWTLTFNGAASIYDSAPAGSITGAQRLRDVQVGFEADRDLGTLPVLGPAVLSGSYYYQDQTSPAILNVSPTSPITGVTLTGLPSGATQVFAEKGSIHIAQVRLGLGPSHSNLRFPIAVSWSNRTELVTRPVWRAQIGLSYDFDSLFSSGSQKQ